MLKENIMKTIAGLSLAAVVMVPSVANAAATISGTNGEICTAATMTEFEDCISKKNISGGNDYSKVTKVTLTANYDIDGDGTDDAFKIDKNITVTDYEITNDIYVDSNKTLTLKGTSNVIGGVTVNKGTLNITTKADTAISTTLDVVRGVANISADNTNGNAASSENSAVAVAGAVTVDAGTLKVTRGELGSTITTNNACTVEVGDVTGLVTINGQGSTTLKANALDGGVTVKGTSAVKVDAKEISTSVTVENEKATVQYANDDVTPTVTKGLVRKTNIESANVTNVEVYVAGLSKVELAKNEVLVIENVNDLGENFTVVGANGAKIDNQSNTDLTITVNGKAVTVSKDADDEDAYVISGAVEEPEQPGDTDNNGGDVTVPTNPATGDSIMSYVALAVSSVASLGLAVKKFLF